MLNLIAISYQNIGPFKDQTISLFFQEGNYLIKAPIGTGKSFLFFDGPTYALYKNSSRNILNVQSKSGTIKLLFEVDGQSYYIVRKLKQGKSKDTTTSQLFTLELAEQELLKKIKSGSSLLGESDIDDLLMLHEIPKEEILFKNETDLQQQLNSLLPPQEVFMSTIFLLQDAENIFEMQPAQRLEVLKNVFGLLGIDESKEILREKRTETRYQIKAFQESSNYEQKLRLLLNNLITNFKELEKLEIVNNEITSAKEIFSELEMMQEKLSIQNFSLEAETKNFLVPLFEKIATEGKKYENFKTKIGLLEQQDTKYTNDIKSLNAQFTSNTDEITKLNTLLGDIKVEEIKKLKAEKNDLLSQQEALEKSVNTNILEDFYLKNRENLNLQQRNNFSLFGSQQCVQELIELGQRLKQEKELFSQQIGNLQEQKIQKQQQLEAQLKHLEEQEQFFLEQEKGILARLAHFDEETEEEAKFDCGALGKPCPFVKAINQKHFQQREEQKKLILQEQIHLNEKIKNTNFSEQKKVLFDELELVKSGTTLKEQLLSLEEKVQRTTTSIEMIRTFLQHFDYKALEQANQKREKLSSELITLEKTIQNQERLLENKERYEQEKISFVSKNEQLKIQISSLEKDQEQVKKEKADQEQILQLFPQVQWNQALRYAQEYEKNLQQLELLIADWKDVQVKIKQLAENEKLLTTLYNVLNKELLLFVLSEYLPILSEIINSYLSSVVDYSISIKLKEDTDKLELETKIIDEKGERDVKSLSGGQRTILKLVRMLAISSYLKTEMLFLDETVNNLDNETVGKVAQLLDSFVKQRKMKFYTITHNSEIQGMSIRDQVLTIEKNKKTD